jgi:hypothetical protein
LDKAKMQKLRDALIAGNTNEDACILAGIGESTFYRWMREAESAPEGHPLWEFRQSVKRAMAEARHRNIMIIQKAAVTHWQAAAWFLERSDPKHWGRKDHVAVGGDASGVPVLTADVPEELLTQEETMAALDAVLKRVREKGIKL